LAELVQGRTAAHAKPADGCTVAIDTDGAFDDLNVGSPGQQAICRRATSRITLLPEAKVTGADAIDLLLDAELTQGALSIRGAGLTETR
jgi:hypothetical protein